MPLVTAGLRRIIGEIRVRRIRGVRRIAHLREVPTALSRQPDTLPKERPRDRARSTYRTGAIGSGAGRAQPRAMNRIALAFEQTVDDVAPAGGTGTRCTAAFAM